MSGMNVEVKNQVYFGRLGTVDRYSTTGLWPVEQELIDEYFPAPPAAVLDLGCGTGRTTTGLVSLGYSTIAIDNSETMIARARKLHPELEFCCMDATKLQFEDMSFDAALFSFNGIDCIYPEKKRIICLKEVFRVLRPGGILVFSTHNILGEMFLGMASRVSAYLRASKLIISVCKRALIQEEPYFYFQDGVDVWLYARLPSATRTQFQKVGFLELAKRGKQGEKNIGTFGWGHAHVNFAIQRPR